MTEHPRDDVPPRPVGRELDPSSSPALWERSVASIVRAAAPELRRRAAPGVTGLIDRWARPLVGAAAAVIVAASATLLWTADTSPAGSGGSAATPGASAVADLGAGERPPAGLETAVYPEPVGPWMEGDEQPTVEEIVFSASARRDRP